MKILTSSAVNLPSSDVPFTGQVSEECYRLAPHAQPHKMCSGLNPEYMSDKIGITAFFAMWICLAHRTLRYTGTLQLGRSHVPRWPQAARWAQCTYIDIHFFSGRQKTSSSITQIRPDSNHKPGLRLPEQRKRLTVSCNKVHSTTSIGQWPNERL